MSLLKGSRSGGKWIGLVLVAVMAGACGDAPSDLAGADENTHEHPPATECPPAADVGAPNLSDEEIADVMMAGNMGEILTNQVARTKAVRQEVREFADSMVTEHTAAQQRLQSRLRQLGITQRESPLSKQLRAEVNQIIAILRTLEGEAFDRAFMDAQVALHAKLLFVMDGVLQPQLRRAELVEEARLAREEAQNHLETATPIQASLAPTR